jgi:hypothetical protein
VTVAELIERLKKVPQDYRVHEGYQGYELERDDVIVFDDTKEVYL